MTKTIVGVFSSQADAEKAVSALRSQNFTTEEINIIAKQEKQSQNFSKNQSHSRNSEMEQDSITDGTMTGGVIGGTGGLLASAGLLAIPGVGPILAAGPIAAALSGMVAGGITGGLVDWGVPSQKSSEYEQHVAQGNTLAIIRADESKIQNAAKVLRDNGAQDVSSHVGKKN
ncbi:general stress protein [Selenomonadales bacterium OttesenSCG-928-I06]|nr:general stress protein [Selenomonadales bacterium OttesenSCG-928-I06]